MYNVSDFKKQIENLKNEISIELDKDEVEFTNEILNLSEELDVLINIWMKFHKKDW